MILTKFSLLLVYAAQWSCWRDNLDIHCRSNIIFLIVPLLHNHNNILLMMALSCPNRCTGSHHFGIFGVSDNGGKAAHCTLSAQNASCITMKSCPCRDAYQARDHRKHIRLIPCCALRCYVCPLAAWQRDDNWPGNSSAAISTFQRWMWSTLPQQLMVTSHKRMDQLIFWSVPIIYIRCGWWYGFCWLSKFSGSVDHGA